MFCGKYLTHCGGFYFNFAYRLLVTINSIILNPCKKLLLWGILYLDLIPGLMRVRKLIARFSLKQISKPYRNELRIAHKIR